jgi:hypothetical protein
MEIIGRTCEKKILQACYEVNRPGRFVSGCVGAADILSATEDNDVYHLINPSNALTRF